ncbi:hypothetical protein MRB53_037008 [Persea americana]|nr:hypothetical protein MRB53_037008 [Persea americana]
MQEHGTSVATRPQVHATCIVFVIASVRGKAYRGYESIEMSLSSPPPVMATPLSPGHSSPRLPSPPPMAEDQTGPQSPDAGMTVDDSAVSAQLDLGASRRIRPGTKAADMAEGPPLMELADIDSAFQLTEHLKALHYSFTHPPDFDTTLPVDRHTGSLLAEAPEGIDRALWLYELCRFLVQKVNTIIVALFSDHPPCSSQTCPEMRASEWQYLCAVHDPPKSCCAIDYCCHTLDWAANTLTSPKHFPSRLTMNGSDASSPQHQIRQLTNIFRRVYRIYAHAWFQHREVFWRVEGKTGLYIFFKTVCDAYGLIPEDNYTIPPEAEGVEPVETPLAAEPPPIMLRRPPEPAMNEKAQEMSESPGLQQSAGATTRRHRQTPSRGTAIVNAVPEEAEDDEDTDPSLHPALLRSGTDVLADPPTIPLQSELEGLDVDSGIDGAQDESTRPTTQIFHDSQVTFPEFAPMHGGGSHDADADADAEANGPGEGLNAHELPSERMDTTKSSGVVEDD